MAENKREINALPVKKDNRRIVMSVKIFLNQPFEMHSTCMRMDYNDVIYNAWMLSGFSVPEDLRLGTISFHAFVNKIGFAHRIYKQDPKTKAYMDSKGPFFRGDVIFVEILPMGFAGFLGEQLSDIGGYVAAGALGFIVGGPFGAAAGVALYGAAKGALYAIKESVVSDAQAGFEDASRQIESIRVVEKLQPIVPSKPLKLESRALNESLVDNRVDPGGVVPELFGSMWYKLIALTAFSRESKSGFVNTYSGYYTAGEGPVEIPEYRISDKRAAELDSFGSLNFDQHQGSTPFQVSNYDRVIASSEFVSYNFPATRDASGLKLNYDKNINTGRLSATFRSSASNNQVALPVVQSNSVPEAYSWVFLFYEVLSSGHATESAANAALQAASVLLGRSIESPFPGSSGWLALRPKANSLLPVFLLEVQFNNAQGVSDNLPSGMGAITGRPSNSVYELLYPGISQMIVNSAFDDFQYTLQSRAFSGLVNGFKLYRLSYSQLASAITPATIANLPVIQSSPQSFIELTPVSFSISLQGLTLPARNEALAKITKKFNQPAPPSVPSYPRVPREPRAPNVDYETVTAVEDGDEDGPTDYVSFLVPTPAFRRNQQAYYDDVEEYNEDVRDYNEDVERIQHRYERRVENWREKTDSFNEDFNAFQSFISNVSILGRRQIRELLDNRPSAFSKSESPPEIVCEIVQRFIEHENLNVNLDDLIDFAEFTAWRTFCTDEELTFNGVFDYETTVFDAIRQVAFCGLAELDFSFGKMRPIIHKVRSTIHQHFHSRNVLNFKYSKGAVSTPDVLIAQFQNEAKMNKFDEVRLYLDGHSADTARKQEVVSLFGITRQSQVEKVLRFQRNLYQGLNETFSFQTDVMGLAARRGDLVGVSHFEIHPSNFTARVHKVRRDSAGKVTAIQIDQNSVPSLQGGQTYTCRVLTQGGVEVEGDVQSISDEQFQSDDDRLIDKDDSPLTTRGGEQLAIRPTRKKTLNIARQSSGAYFSDDTAEISAGDYILFGIKNSIFRKAVVKDFSMDRNLKVTVLLAAYSDSLYDLTGDGSGNGGGTSGGGSGDGNGNGDGGTPADTETDLDYSNVVPPGGFGSRAWVSSEANTGGAYRSTGENLDRLPDNILGLTDKFIIYKRTGTAPKNVSVGGQSFSLGNQNAFDSFGSWRSGVYYKFLASRARSVLPYVGNFGTWENVIIS